MDEFVTYSLIVQFIDIIGQLVNVSLYLCILYASGSKCWK